MKFFTDKLYSLFSKFTFLTPSVQNFLSTNRGLIDDKYLGSDKN